TARHVGNSMVDANGNAAPIQAFIGDNVTLTSATQVNDVDLYRFELRTDVTDFSMMVTPTAGLTSTPSLDAYVRLFNSTGVELQAVDNGGPGNAETLGGLPLGKGTYYVGVSSAGDTSYVPGTGSG